MMARRIALAAAVSLLVSVVCWAEITWTFTEDFEGDLADASWRAGPGDEVVAQGGNPGAFLRNPAAVTSIPAISTVSPIPWIYTGNYRILGVTDLGIDVRIFSASGETDARPVSLGLVNKGSTPADPTDDCELVLLGREMPRPGSGWRSYGFHVPAWKPSMPARWTVYGRCASWPRDEAWSYVLQQVSEARFYLGDPGVTYDLATLDVGFDNAKITMGKRDAGPSLASVGAAVPMNTTPQPNDQE